MAGNCVILLKPGESVRIGDAVVFAAQHGTRVRLVIRAPAEVPITRSSAKLKTPKTPRQQS